MRFHYQNYFFVQTLVYVWNKLKIAFSPSVCDCGAVTNMIPFPKVLQIRTKNCNKSMQIQTNNKFVYFDDFIPLKTYLDNISMLLH